MLSSQEKTFLKQFKTKLEQTLGDRLVELRLFGSRARGDADEGSDFDVLIIVDRRTDDVREMVLDADVEMMNPSGKRLVVSPTHGISSVRESFYEPASKVISKSRFVQLCKEGTSFIHNVSNDAITV